MFLLLRLSSDLICLNLCYVHILLTLVAVLFSTCFHLVPKSCFRRSVVCVGFRAFLLFLILSHRFYHNAIAVVYIDV